MISMTLDHDILWTVFIHNASNGRSRLESTLASSQVCQAWRNIILGSSTLWGRLVLLTPYRKQEWIEEIIRRSGSSPLWVEVLLGDTIEQLLSVANNYWERIELLDISGTAIRLLCHEGDLSKVLSRPAPCLRSFSLINTNHSMHRNISFQNYESLFTLDAPLLRSLVTNAIVLPRECVLLSKLCVLSWRMYGTIRGMLDSLTQVPNVEALTLRKSTMVQNIDRNALDSLPQISLLNLTHLNMPYSSLEVFVALFDRMTMSSMGCRSKISINISSRGDVLNNCLLQMGRPLAKFVTNHVKLKEDSHKLSLRIWNHKFFFTLDSSSQIKFHWKNYRREHAAPSDTLSLFFDTFKTPDLTFITDLTIIRKSYVSRYHFGAFLRFLSSSLSSITHLETTTSFFRLFYLHFIQNHDCAFVPFDHLDCDSPFSQLQHLKVRLSVVHAEECFSDRAGVKLDTHILLHFLRRQKALGRGPSVLHVHEIGLNSTGSHKPYFRELLEEIEGLEVVWTRHQSS